MTRRNQMSRSEQFLTRGPRRLRGSSAQFEFSLQIDSLDIKLTGQYTDRFVLKYILIEVLQDDPSRFPQENGKIQTLVLYQFPVRALLFYTLPESLESVFSVSLKTDTNSNELKDLSAKI